MKTYIGSRSYYGCHVVVHRPRNTQPLNPRTDIANHSPTGFGWGYLGSGPRQLALAILADCVGQKTALEYYDAFAHDVIARLDHEVWVLSSAEIRDWIRLKQQLADGQELADGSIRSLSGQER